MLKKIFLTLGIIVSSWDSFSQVSPYSLSTKWMFGYKAGFNFNTGTGGAVGAPALLSGNPTDASLTQTTALEESSSLVDTAGNLVIYSNSSQVFGNNNALARDLFVSDAIAGTSATNGCVIIPDPASPNDQYYLFIANDNTGGPAAGKGIRYYKFKKSGTTVTYLSGPTQLSTGTQTDESLAIGTDGTGGYWLITHNFDATYANTQYWVWHITSGGVSGVDKQTSTAGVFGSVNGTIKINQCQNKIAWTGNSAYVQVYDWDRTTGKIGTNRYSGQVPAAQQTTNTPSYGLEFSPDGSKVFQSSLGSAGSENGKLHQLTIATSTWSAAPLATGSINGNNEIGTMQLGPDGNIYVTQVTDVGNYTGNTYVGKISTPNTTPTWSATGVQIKASAAGVYYPSIYRGIANIAWLTPNTVVAGGRVKKGATSCQQFTFGFNFRNYFNDKIDLTSATWSFKDNVTNITTTLNAPSPYYDSVNYTLPTLNAFTVSVSVVDNVCGQTWVSNSFVITPATCSLPVELISFTAKPEGTNSIKLNWVTATEKNNSYFEIQRSSDGLNYTKIGVRSGNGNAWTSSYYSFLDDHAPSGLSYYRLVQYDTDGTHSISKVVSLYTNEDEKSSITIAPNPFQNDLAVTINNVTEQPVTLFIYDSYGNVQEKLYVDNTSQPVKIGAGLAKGNYILKVVLADDTYHEKIVKE